MSVQEDLRRIADRAQRELDSVHDFFEHEHNAGIVNEIYLRKAAKKARYALGDPIEIDDAYHLESWRLIKKVVTDVTNAASSKLSKA